MQRLLGTYAHSGYRNRLRAHSESSHKQDKHILQKWVDLFLGVYFLPDYNLSSGLLLFTSVIKDSSAGTMLPFCQAHLPLGHAALSHRTHSRHHHMANSPRSPRTPPSAPLASRAAAAPAQVLLLTDAKLPAARYQMIFECHEPSFVARALAYED